MRPSSRWWGTESRWRNDRSVAATFSEGSLVRSVTLTHARTAVNSGKRVGVRSARLDWNPKGARGARPREGRASRTRDARRPRGLPRRLAPSAISIAAPAGHFQNGVRDTVEIRTPGTAVRRRLHRRLDVFRRTRNDNYYFFPARKSSSRNEDEDDGHMRPANRPHVRTRARRRKTFVDAQQLLGALHYEKCFSKDT